MKTDLRAALIGLGNILLKDERIGVHVVNTIGERYSFSPDIEIIDGGTLGLNLLPAFEEFDRILIVDAVNFGREPGYIGILENDEIPAIIFPKISVHHIGLADLLSVAKLKGIMPSQLCLIGMQPCNDDFCFGLEMSDIVNANIEKLIELTLQKLQEWGIESVLQSPSAA
jgi:hydrogenase maturation protease